MTIQFKTKEEQVADYLREGIIAGRFPRGARLEDYKKFRDMTGVDALGLDQNVSVDYARAALKGKIPLQGNLDPELLVTGGDKMKESA